MNNNQQVHIQLVISHEKSSVHGHESFKILIYVVTAVFKSTTTNTVLMKSILQKQKRVWTEFIWLRIEDEWRTFVNAVMTLWVLYARILLTL
jgi:hypothetical protein